MVGNWRKVEQRSKNNLKRTWKHWRDKKNLALRISQKEIWENFLKVISKKIKLTSKKIFGKADFNREERCRILRTLIKTMKVTKLLSSSKDHKEKCTRWTKCMQIEFSSHFYWGIYKYIRWTWWLVYILGPSWK